MNLTVFGSRSLYGKEVQQHIIQVIGKYIPDMILTAGDPLKVHFLNYKKNGQGAPDQRSKAILRETDQVLFIYDGHSKGTKHEIDLATKLKIQHEIILMDPDINDHNQTELQWKW